MASDILSFLPSALIELFESTEWKGGPLLVLANSVARPTADEIVVNHPWLKPMVLYSPARVGGSEEMFILKVKSVSPNHTKPVFKGPSKINIEIPQRSNKQWHTVLQGLAR